MITLRHFLENYNILSFIQDRQSLNARKMTIFDEIRSCGVKGMNDEWRIEFFDISTLSNNIEQIFSARDISLRKDYIPRILKLLSIGENVSLTLQGSGTGCTLLRGWLHLTTFTTKVVPNFEKRLFEHLRINCQAASPSLLDILRTLELQYIEHLEKERDRLDQMQQQFFLESKQVQDQIRAFIDPHYEETMSDYLRFEDVIRERLNDEGQYVSRFVDGSLGCPNLGVGLRFDGDPIYFTTFKIHKDDVETFIRRYQEHKEKRKREVLESIN